MVVIVVSGTPGTGKTTLAKKIAEEQKLRYVDVNKVIEENNLSEDIDEERQTKIVDVKRLNKVLIETIKKEKNIVIDSHLSHFLPKKYVDRCIITKCRLKELRKRLESRGYPEEKIRENLDAEIFDVCRIEAFENGHKIQVIDTSS